MVGALDRLEAWLDRADGKLDGAEKRLTQEPDLDPEEPLSPPVAVGLILANALLVGGSAWFFELLLSGVGAVVAVGCVAGVFLLGGLGLLFGRHASQKMTGAVVTLFNACVVIWLLL
jgi:hypothetical protein